MNTIDSAPSLDQKPNLLAHWKLIWEMYSARTNVHAWMQKEAYLPAGKTQKFCRYCSSSRCYARTNLFHFYHMDFNIQKGYIIPTNKRRTMNKSKTCKKKILLHTYISLHFCPTKIWKRQNIFAFCLVF